MPGIESIEKDVIYFGRVNFRNANRLFGIKRKDRRQHMYVIGKTGTGKTTLIHNMMVQDVANGEGMAVVDPHGELVEGLLEKIPHERLTDVVYFNPADPEFAIGFNPLELPDPKYKHLVASGLMGIFTKIWSGVWSARMEYILNNAILALLDTPGSTLLGITRLLVDKEFRQRIVANVKDPVVRAFWVNEYEEWKDQFRNEAIAPIQNKVGQFLSTALVRNIVGQSKSTIDLFDIMNTGKILLVNVSKGRIGEDNSALLGAMIITKLQLAAMERVRIPEEERVDFFLYVDEFQNFATDSFANILSEARKYRLNLTMAHQYVGQLVTDTSTKVRDAVFGNVGTMIMFRVGAADAEFLEKEFEPEFTIQDMVGLPNAHIYLKLMVNGVTSRPFSATTLPPFKLASSEHIAQEVIESSRRRYAQPRYLVEEDIQEWSGMNVAGGGGLGRSSGAGKFPAVCSSCGKETMVPFEPIPGRPVYCLDCLNKIKTGELQPVRGMPQGPTVDELPRRGTLDDLAGLGIEFEAGRPPARPAGPRRPVERGGPPHPAKPHPPMERPASQPERSAAPSPRPHPVPATSPHSALPKPQPAPAPRGFMPRPLKPVSAKHSPSEGKTPHSVPSSGTSQAPRRRSILETLFASPDGGSSREVGLAALASKSPEDAAREERHRQKAFAKKDQDPNIDDLRAALRNSLQKLSE